jgi:1-acyl-sn-glycerol-3-phosphate acyltransferase
MILSRLLRTLFGLYALIIFLCTLILSSLCYFFIFTFVDQKRAPFIAHQYISRTWAATILFLFGIRTVVKDKRLLDPDQVYVFIANHRSQLDIPAYAVATDHTIRFLAKSELMKLPLMGYIIKHLYVSVDRKDKVARAKSMDNMIASLKEGISVFICPEGTRNKSADPLLPFHDGAFRLAIQSQNPLACMVIINSDKLLSPLRPIELSPGRLTCIWLKPFSTKGMTLADLPQLKESVVREMTKHLTVA